MNLLNLLLDKIDEIRWNLTWGVEDFVDKIKHRCTGNPESCQRTACNCPWVEEVSVKPKKKKNVKKNKKNC